MKVLIIFFMIFLVSCKPINKDSYSENELEKTKLQAYVSIFPLYDFAKKIAGDTISVELLSFDHDFHDAEIEIEQLKNLEKADLFIYNGFGVEDYIDEIKDTLSNKNIVYLETTKDIEGALSIHTWLDPKLLIFQIEKIKNSFVELNPQSKDLYENNFEIQKKKLEELDRDFEFHISSSDKNEVLVSHNSFLEWEKYGLHQIFIENTHFNIDTDSKQMIKIIDYINNNKTKYILAEDLNSNIIKTIVDQTGIEVLILNSIEHLSADQIKNGNDYFDIMRQNLEILKIALK